MSIKTFKFITKVLKYLLNTFFPEYCFLCKNTLVSDEIAFCNNCLNFLTYVNYSDVCSICFSKKVNNSNHICIENSELDRNISLFEYSGEMKEFIHEVKYHFRKRLLEGLLNKIESIDLFGENPDVIIPVPLHKKRKKWRGFNQSLIIADWISKTKNIPVDNGFIMRTKDTTPQSQLDAEKRSQNIKKAFEIKDKKKKYENVLIVDDVMTTGNTLIECAKVLKNHGSKKVISFTLFRA